MVCAVCFLYSYGVIPVKGSTYHEPTPLMQGTFTQKKPTFFLRVNRASSLPDTTELIVAFILSLTESAARLTGSGDRCNSVISALPPLSGM